MTLFVDQPIRNFRISEIKSYREQKSKKLGHYLLGEVLGQGGFASVYKVQDIHTKQLAAAKFMKIPLQSDATIRKIDEQVQILRIVDHPNIVRIYETFKNQTNYVIVTELIKGRQLFQYVCNHGPLSEALAARIFHQIVLAVKYLHEREIVHRDIKTENIMIDQNFNAKLIDFGLATSYKKGNLLSTMCGSPSYVAPQMLQKKQYDGTKIDIWCLGVVLYVLLEANLPFDNNTEQQRIQNIKKMKWHTATISSPEAIQLYQKIFQSSNERIDMDELLNSTFFKKYYLKDSESQSSPRFSKKEQCQAINQIQRMLQVSEQAVKLEIKEKKLGNIYAVYNLLMKKKQKTVSQILKRDSKTLELKSNVSRSSNQEQQGKREKQKVYFKLQKVETKLSSTPKPRRSVIKQIEPILKNSVKITLKTDDLKKSLLTDSGLYIEQKGKVRGRELYRGKKIFGHKIEVQKKKEIQEIKPRLREDSPQSPKRILDCLRKYN